MSVHNTAAVRVDPRSAYFVGKLDHERIRRIQFPLALAWAKTIQKSQGATELAGIMATLDRHAARMPGSAYVALLRCQRLQDVHLRAFHESCIEAPAGVETALSQLRAQQARAEPTMNRAWRAIFEPADVPDVEEVFPESATVPLNLLRERRATFDAEEAGEEPTHVCLQCREGFYMQAALMRHTKAARKQTSSDIVRKARARLSARFPRRAGDQGDNAPVPKRRKLSAASFVPGSERPAA